jgi:signal recognition particle GTPase
VKNLTLWSLFILIGWHHAFLGDGRRTSLIEKAQAVFDADEAAIFEQKMRKEEFTLDCSWSKCSKLKN